MKEDMQTPPLELKNAVGYISSQIILKYYFYPNVVTLRTMDNKIMLMVLNFLLPISKC